MAARKNLSHATKTREKIQTSQLVNRLTNHALAEYYGVSEKDMPKTTLTVSQIKAIEILLKKTLPDLKQVEVTGPDGGPQEHKWTVEVVNAPTDS